LIGTLLFNKLFRKWNRAVISFLKIGQE
jgi:hypothetical protein